jgi:hypothetical protein
MARYSSPLANIECAFSTSALVHGVIICGARPRWDGRHEVLAAREVAAFAGLEEQLLRAGRDHTRRCGRDRTRAGDVCVACLVRKRFPGSCRSVEVEKWRVPGLRPRRWRKEGCHGKNRNRNMMGRLAIRRFASRGHIPLNHTQMGRRQESDVAMLYRTRFGPSLACPRYLRVSDLGLGLTLLRYMYMKLSSTHRTKDEDCHN